MNRFALIILGTLLLLTEFAVASCLPAPLYLALIRVEACEPIEGEQNLLVTSKIQGFIETDEREPKELSVTMIDDWKAQPAEAFVWMQSDQNARDCRYIEQLDPFVAP